MNAVGDLLQCEGETSDSFGEDMSSSEKYDFSSSGSESEEGEEVLHDRTFPKHGVSHTLLLLDVTSLLQNSKVQYKYLQKVQETKVLLERLVSAGKNLFLITNSGFPFIDAGMRYMVGPEWMGLFDIVITNARKPKFFHAGSRPFRLYDPELETHSWGRVTALEKGKIYQQGNLHRLRQMTGWFGPRVLYFGDHVYSDLADPSLRYGWRTGAIIPELEREIELQNKPEFKAAVKWLVTLQHLIREMQHQNSPESKQVIAEWLRERDEMRKFTKSMFNPHFGSLFRTYHNPTYFFRRLARFADIYTSSLTNILYYPDDYTFYPHRVILPHEPGLEL